jgi:hypothetical protein
MPISVISFDPFFMTFGFYLVYHLLCFRRRDAIFERILVLTVLVSRRGGGIGLFVLRFDGILSCIIKVISVSMQPEIRSLYFISI